MSKSLSTASRFSERYRKALGRYLKHGTRAKPLSSVRLGREAVDLGMAILDLAMIHEKAVIAEVKSLASIAARDRMIRRAGKFFAATIIPMEETHRAALEANASLSRLNQSLARHTRNILVSSQKLKTEVARRKSVEQALHKSECRSGKILEQSVRMQEELRQLSRQILSAQEEDRKRISRELHDIIAQTLTGINVHLTSLKMEAAQNSKGLTKNIARTQKLVEKAVDRVHRFARELRPAVLDDLGLVPALQSLIELFTAETGIKVRFKTVAGLAELSNEQRTVLYRVAQEALNNVGQHAHASLVTLNIKELVNSISMQIKDNGRSFDVNKVSHSRKRLRMGLLGMRERVDMVGGKFTIICKSGKGTTIGAEMPLRNGRKRRGLK